jgi:hypothetical protein
VREAPDVADEQLASRGEPVVQRGVTLHGSEPPQIHSPGPVVHAPDTVAPELRHRVPARRQRATCGSVDGPEPAPRHPLGGAGAVATGESRQIGLVHRDNRQSQRPGGEGGLCAENGGAGHVHDVRREVAQHLRQPRPWSGDAELG